MNVLALDLAFNNVGYVTYFKNMITSYGVIRPKPFEHDLKSFSDAYHAKTVAKQILDVIKASDTDRIVVEVPGGSQSQRASKLLGVIVGIITTVSAATKIQLDLVTPNDVKMMLDKRDASKKEMIAWASAFLPRLKDMSLKDAEHIADAIAVFEFWKKGEIRLWL